MKLKLNLFTKMKKPVCKLPLSLKITLFVLFSFASLLEVQAQADGRYIEVTGTSEIEIGRFET